MTSSAVKNLDGINIENISKRKFRKFSSLVHKMRELINLLAELNEVGNISSPSVAEDPCAEKISVAYDGSERESSPSDEDPHDDNFSTSNSPYPEYCHAEPLTLADVDGLAKEIMEITESDQEQREMMSEHFSLYKANNHNNYLDNISSHQDEPGNHKGESSEISSLEESEPPRKKRKITSSKQVSVDYETAIAKRKERKTREDPSGEHNRADLEDEESESEGELHTRTRSKKIHCGQSSRSSVVSHVKRTNPISTTTLTPAPSKERPAVFQCLDCQYSTHRSSNFKCHELHHQKKFAHSCPLCTYSANTWNHVTRHLNQIHSNAPLPDDKTHEKEDHRSTNSPSSFQAEEEWYYYGNGRRRIRYLFCHDCGYKTINVNVMEKHAKTIHPLSKTALPYQQIKEKHVQTIHPLSKTALPPQQTKEEGAAVDTTTSNVNSGCKATFNTGLHRLKCPDCDYSTYLSTDYKRHKVLHTRDEKYKCSICSFSAKHEKTITRHEFYFHLITGSSEYIVKRISEVDAEETKDPDGRDSKENANKRLLSPLRLYTPPIAQSSPVKPTNALPRLSTTEAISSYVYAPHEEGGVKSSTSSSRNPQELQDREKSQEELWHYLPNGHRRRYFFCGDCFYKSTNRASLLAHIEKNHPGSSTAALKLHQRGPHRERREQDPGLWYFPPYGGWPARYLFCGDCDYKNKSRAQLQNHIKKHHPGSSMGALPQS